MDIRGRTKFINCEVHHMGKHIIIIGAGVAGLTAGIYAKLSGVHGKMNLQLHGKENFTSPVSSFFTSW